MAKKITRAEVEKIASLARLDLSEDERERSTRELSNIIEYIDRLSEVPTDGVALYGNESEPLNELRDDRSDFFHDRAELLGAGNFQDGLLVTKGVFFDRKRHDS